MVSDDSSSALDAVKRNVRLIYKLFNSHLILSISFFILIRDIVLMN